jgi:hypothetical protein
MKQHVLADAEELNEVFADSRAYQLAVQFGDAVDFAASYSASSRTHSDR